MGETSIMSDQYDFTISLLHLGNSSRCYDSSGEESEDTFDRMMKRTPGSSWLD